MRDWTCDQSRARSAAFESGSDAGGVCRGEFSGCIRRHSAGWQARAAAACRSGARRRSR